MGPLYNVFFKDVLIFLEVRVDCMVYVKMTLKSRG